MNTLISFNNQNFFLITFNVIIIINQIKKKHWRLKSVQGAFK